MQNTHGVTLPALELMSFPLALVSVCLNYRHKLSCKARTDISLCVLRQFYRVRGLLISRAVLK